MIALSGTRQNGGSVSLAHPALLSSANIASAAIPVSVAGTINGWTVAPYPAQSPLNLEIDFSSLTVMNFVIRLDINGVFWDVTFSPTDPAADHWIDDSAFATTADYANALAGFVNSTFYPNFHAELSGSTTVIIADATGASVSMGVAIITGTSEIVVTGGGSGSDAIPASGQVDLASIASAVPGKSIKFNADDGLFTVSGASGWNGLVMLDYLGDTLAILLSFNPLGLSDGVYSINDLAAIPGAFLDGTVLASGLQSSQVRLSFVAAVDEDTDFGGGTFAASGTASAT